MTLTPEQLEELRRIDSPTVANAIEAFKLRDRTEGYCDMSIRCLFPDLGTMVGYVVTCTADSTTYGRTRGREGTFALWRAVAAAPKPVVIVMQNVGPERERSCHMGDVMANIARRLGAVGLITDGGVRDLPEVHALGFHYFAAGAVVSHGNSGIVEVGYPVKVGGCLFKPGDLVHADSNGIVNVPLEIADKVAAEVEQVRARERRVIEYVRSPEFTLEGLWDLFSH